MNTTYMFNKYHNIITKNTPLGNKIYECMRNSMHWKVDLNSFGTHCRCVNKNSTDNLIRPFINIIAWHLETNECNPLI